MRAKKREIALLEKSDLPSTQERLELGQIQKRLRNFTDKYNPPRQYIREKAYGIGKQPRALWAVSVDSPKAPSNRPRGFIPSVRDYTQPADLSKLPKLTKKESLSEAVRNTNPGYLTGLPEYTKNCQRAVMAYDARRQSCDVHAGKRILNMHDDMAYNHVIKSQYFMEKDIFKKLKGRSYIDKQNSIKKELLSASDGSRGIILVRWKNWRRPRIYS